ncbi:MAG: energy transducer TonB [Planctomycetota bacterium]
MEPEIRSSSLKRFSHTFAVLSGGLVLALGCFLLLPLLRAITAPPKADLELRKADTTQLPPPPPPKQEEEKKQEEEEPPPPAPAADAPPLDLSDLEMVLSGGFGDGGGTFAGSLPLALPGGGSTGNMADLFNMGDLEEKPRVIFRARPELTREMRKRMPCTVNILMTVNKQGRVVNPTVYSTDDPLFNDSALKAIRQWKFEPGKRKGKPDDFRVRQPITFK